MGSNEESLEFEDFWNVYPRKDNKKKACSTWNRLTKKKRRLAIADCKTRYENTQKIYIPLPTTYLNGERWEDERLEKHETERMPVTNAEWEAKGKALGVHPGVGDTWESYKRKIASKIGGRS